MTLAQGGSMRKLLGKIFKLVIMIFRNGGLCIGHETKHRLKIGGDRRSALEKEYDIKRRLGLGHGQIIYKGR